MFFISPPGGTNAAVHKKRMVVSSLQQGFGYFMRGEKIRSYFITSGFSDLFRFFITNSCITKKASQELSASHKTLIEILVGN